MSDITLNAESLKAILARKIAARIYARLQPVTHTNYSNYGGSRLSPAEWYVDLNNTKRRTLDTGARIDYDGDTTITLTLTYDERDL